MQHLCSKNHLFDSSKSMESDASVKMMIKAVDNYQVFYTSTMVCDDDSTIRANCKWSYKDLHYKIHCLNGQKTTAERKRQTMDAFHYTSKNLFSYLIPASHLVCVLLRPCFLMSLVPKCDARLTKNDWLRLKIYYGCFIKKSRHNHLKISEQYQHYS